MTSHATTTRPTRDVFGETVKRLGVEDRRIVVLDADLSESTRSAWFAEEHPDRFFEMGIQEANMISTAAGLAMSGKVAFCCSFSCFITSRFDQIKVSVAYNNANVRIVGTHAGCGVGPDGYTQMALEDVAILRSLPNMAVLQPADDIEAAQMVEYLVRDYQGPAFLRLTRQKVPRIHDESYRFDPGKLDLLCEGDDLLICGTGACTSHAMEAAARLKDEGISVGVANIGSIAPLDVEGLASAARRAGRVLTVEDHGVVGGMGAAVCEALSEREPTRVHRV
ncbi:MAG: transketolase family protein, partial [Deltaproteobacteria bacterium]|nr:transketolase family protein [Deltaproteobacteria bacterium]